MQRWALVAVAVVLSWPLTTVSKVAEAQGRPKFAKITQDTPLTLGDKPERTIRGEVIDWELRGQGSPFTGIGTQIVEIFKANHLNPIVFMAHACQYDFLRGPILKEVGGVVPPDAGPKTEAGSKIESEGVSVTVIEFQGRKYLKFDSVEDSITWLARYIFDLYPNKGKTKLGDYLPKEKEAILKRLGYLNELQKIDEAYGDKIEKDIFSVNWLRVNKMRKFKF